MNRRSILLACYVLLQGFNSSSAQVIIDTAYNRYVRQVPQQKLHLHFDNNSYLPGDTIWYKAYLFSGAEPAAFGKSVYVDWYDDNGRYLTRTVSPVSNAAAASRLPIPKEYTGRKLEVVAYTQWMLNFDSSFLFHRTIHVLQARKKERIIPAATGTSLQFFPEGGDMVQGILSTIAFKATDKSGYPVAVNGMIRNRAGENITGFSSRYDGMGILKFIPDAADSYTAEWNDANGKSHVTALPAARQQGILLSVGTGFADRPFSIQRSENTPDELKLLYLVVQSQGQIVFRANINLSGKTQVTGKLPASQFPSGIAQVTVFNNKWQPVSERIIFVNNNEFSMDARLSFDTLNVKKRGKNVFYLKVNDSIPATYSLAVTDNNSGYSAENSIITDFLLSGDIKGYVHNPSYYFSSREDSVARHLDFVMLTNGWRKYKWEDVLEAHKPAMAFPVDTNYISLMGRIEGVPANIIEKAKTVNLVLLAKDSSKQYLFLPLTQKGDFASGNLLIFDTVKVYFKLNQAPLASKATMSLTNNLLPVDTNKIVQVAGPQNGQGQALADMPDSVRNQLTASLKRTSLEEVTVRAKAKTKVDEMDEQYTSGMFRGDGSYQFDVANNPNASQSVSVFHYLQSRVAGLVIKMPGINSVSITWQNAPTLVFLDEMEIADPTMIFNIPMNDVAYIKAFRPPFWGGFLGGAGGAIAVYTKKGSDATKGLKGLNNVSVGGYTSSKEFYSPDYSLTNEHSIFDARRTLLWKPKIMTDAMNRQVRIEFFNNDVTHNFRVVLEGMNNDGRMVHYTTILR